MCITAIQLIVHAIGHTDDSALLCVVMLGSLIILSMSRHMYTNVVLIIISGICGVYFFPSQPI